MGHVITIQAGGGWACAVTDWAWLLSGDNAGERARVILAGHLHHCLFAAWGCHISVITYMSYDTQHTYCYILCRTRRGWGGGGMMGTAACSRGGPGPRPGLQRSAPGQGPCVNRRARSGVAGWWWWWWCRQRCAKWQLAPCCMQSAARPCCKEVQRPGSVCAAVRTRPPRAYIIYRIACGVCHASIAPVMLGRCMCVLSNDTRMTHEPCNACGSLATGGWGCVCCVPPAWLAVGASLWGVLLGAGVCVRR